MGRVVGVGNAARVHELNVDVATGLVDGIGDFLPAFDVCVGIDAGRGGVALAIVGGLRTLCDQEAK